jgi:glycosyltransferase involved in cell wall biosynthesis
MPTFSVCIPTYNAAAYLPEAIDSVLAQTFGDFELLICDDASTDNTAKLVAGYHDERIRYIGFSENLGQSGNFNRCIDEAQGENWTLLSADDRFLPEFLERAHAALTEQPDADFFIAGYRRVDAGGSVLGENRPWPSPRVVPVGGFLEELLQGSVFHTLTLVVRRELLRRVGHFRDDVRWGHDWDWVLRLVAQGAGVYWPELLADYREHDASGTAEALQGGTNGPAELRILREALDRGGPGLDDTVGKRALRAFAIRQLYFAQTALELGSGSAGVANLRCGAAASPWVMTRTTFWSLLGRSVAQRARHG